jgi:hypothetical protein
MLYHRWWLPGKVYSTEGFSVLPSLDRGIVYQDKSGRYFVNSVCQHDLKRSWSEYAFGPDDVFFAPADSPMGTTKVPLPIEQRRLIAERVREALTFHGAQVVWTG